MATWPPEYLFLLACGVSGLAGYARLLGTDAPHTLRNVAHAVLLHGTVGGCFGGIGHDLLGWKGKPLAMVGFSGLYGAGLIAPAIISRIAEGALALKNAGGSDGKGDEK